MGGNPSAVPQGADWRPLRSHVGKATCSCHHRCTYNLLDHAGSSRRNGALLDNDSAGSSVLGHSLAGALESAQIGGVASSETIGLGRRVDANEDNVGLTNAALNVGGENKVGLAGAELEGLANGGEEGGRLVGAIAGNANNLREAGLVNGKVRRVPRSNAVGVEVDDVDSQVGVVESYQSSSWATCECG